MRNLFIIGMLLVGAFMAGWFKIHREGDQTTISINRAEIRQDTRKAIDRGREILDRQQERLAREEQPYDSRFDDRITYPPASTLTDGRGEPVNYQRDHYPADRFGATDRSPYPYPPTDRRAPYGQPAPSERDWNVNQTYGRPAQSIAPAPSQYNDRRYQEDLRYQAQPRR